MIDKVRIKNFRSLRDVTVELGALTFLVGQNGAGKSNFLIALDFLNRCLLWDIETAVNHHGGIPNIIHRSPRENDAPMEMSLNLTLFADVKAFYSFSIGQNGNVEHEVCLLNEKQTGERVLFEIRNGKFEKELPGVITRIEPGRLALPLLAGSGEVAPVFAVIRYMSFYTFKADRLRMFFNTSRGEALFPDASNAASVLRHSILEDSRKKEIFISLMKKIIPEFQDVDVDENKLNQERFFLIQNDARIPNNLMSDGTLQMIGIFLALYQEISPLFASFEEPESTLHPGALEILVEEFLDASRRTQIVVTTHSADMLDHKGITDKNIRYVEFRNGETVITPPGRVSMEAIREKLYTPGDLLRMEQFDIDEEYLKNHSG